jgi:hypothetical protein
MFLAVASGFMMESVRSTAMCSPFRELAGIVI